MRLSSSSDQKLYEQYIFNVLGLARVVKCLSRSAFPAIRSKLQYLLDTYALYWHLIGSPRLSSSAANVFTKAQAGKAVLVIYYVVLAELYYLLQKYGQTSLFAPLLQNLQTIMVHPT